MTPEGAATHYGGVRSNSMFAYAYTSTPVASAPGRGYHHSTTPAAGSADDSIVRKLLFSEAPPSTPVSSSAVSVSLQTLFSQAQTATPTSGSYLSCSVGSLHGLPQQRHHVPPPLVSAPSLDEIEKKLTEEVPSPSPKSTADKMVAPTTSGSGEPTILLQPSAFVIPPPASSAVAATALLPTTHTTTSSAMLQVFPAIPPLMPSAGMTAPPMKTQSDTVSSSPAKAAQKSATASSNQIQPQGSSASHHPPKGKAPIAAAAAREHLSAIHEAPMSSNGTSTDAAGGDSTNTVSAQVVAREEKPAITCTLQ